MSSLKLVSAKRFLSESRSNICVYLEDILENDLLDELTRCLRREIPCEVFVSSKALKIIENNAFALINLLKLRKFGAFIYQKNFEDCPYDILFFRDFNTLFGLKNNESEWETMHRSEPKFTDYDFFFRVSPPEYRIEKDDLLVEFHSESALVFERTATKIYWDITNASSIYIDGIGEVESSGQKTITLLNDTVLKLKAVNQGTAKFKAIKIGTISDFKIDYEVQFMNPASKEFVKLHESDFGGVFGIASGYDIKLIWNVPHADQVLVKPFGFYDNKGSYIFNSSGSIEINIEAKFRGKIHNKKILIYAFPVPVFERKFIEIQDRFVLSRKIELNDIRRRMYNDLRNRESHSFRSVMESLNLKTISLRSQLLEKLKDHGFDSFYEKHSIPKLSKQRKATLLNYFKERPKVKDTINSIKNYYD